MKRPIPTLKDQTGAVAITVAILMFVLVGFAALAIDIGYLLVTRNELQNVADAAALAATRKLGKNYQDMLTLPHAKQAEYDCDTPDWGFPCSDIVDVALAVGLENRAGQVDIVIDPDEVFIGVWDFSPDDPSVDPFTEQDAQPRAVRVIARRDEAQNNPITTFLAGVLGVDTMAVSAVATASLSGQGSVAEGELELPIGIDEGFFNDEDEDGYCHDQIVLHPTKVSCAGWTSWDYGHGVSNMRGILRGELLGPESAVEDEFNYSGGVSAALFPELLTLFKNKGYDVRSDGVTPVDFDNNDEPLTGALSADDYPPGLVQPLYEDDGETPLYYPLEPDQGPHDPLVPRNRHVWETTVVVFEAGECGNPNQSAETRGFARITITDVFIQPDLFVQGRVECDYVSGEPTRGGGGEYGTIGPIPQLVQ
jgi:hypothetical protein